MMDSLRIGCIGEAMIELSGITVPGTAKLGFAGDVLNTAIYLRRGLPKHHSVAFVTVVGSDPLSDGIESFLAEEGIETSSVERDASRSSGLYAISTAADGERTFTYWRNQSAARRLFQSENTISFEGLEGFDVLYLSGITLAILPDNVREGLMGFIDGFRDRGGRVVFDSNYRPNLWLDQPAAQRSITEMWARCDIGLPSLDDECALFGDSTAEGVVTRLTKLGVTQGALKRSALGPMSLETHDPLRIEFPPATSVVDTTAAGDSFNGGFLAKKLSGAPVSDCLMAGHALASRVVSHAGAILPR